MNIIKLFSHKNCVSFFIFLVISIIYFFPGFSNKILWGHDTSKITFPFSYYLDESLKNRKLETWNPYIYFGFPLGAEQGQYGIAYPLNLLHAVLPFGLALTILAIIHFTLAGFFTHLYCRIMKLRFAPSFFSGMAYMFNGFIVSHGQYPSHIYGYAWLPLVFLLLSLGSQNQRIKYYILAGSILGLQALTGHPNIFFITIIGSAFYLIATEFRKPFKLLKNTLVMTGGMVITALPYLWQLKTLLPLSNRARGVDFLDATNSSVHFLDLINFISPHFFFNNLEQNWHFGETWHRFGYWGQIETTGFVGISTLVLCVLAINKIKLKNKLPLLLICIVSILIAFGRNTPLYEMIFYKLPVLNGLRAPGKFLLLTDFTLAVLAGFGYDYLLSLQNAKKMLKKLLPALVVLLSLIVLLVWLYFDGSLHSSHLATYVRDAYAKDGFFNDQEDIPRFIRQSTTLHISFPLIICGLIASVMLLVKTDKNKLVMIVIPIILLFEVVNFIKPINQWNPWKDMLHQQNEVISKLKNSLSDQYRVYTYTDFWSDLMPNQLIPHHLYEANGFSSLHLTRFSNWQSIAQSTKRDNLLAMGSIRYLYDNYQLREISNPLPRAYLATKWRNISSENEILTAFSSPAYSANIPIVEVENITDGGAKNQIITPIQLTKDTSDSITLEVNNLQKSLLVLNDTNYPGWSAYVDSKKTSIIQTNYLFRGIFLSPGKHKVEFKYKPNGWILTLCLSWLWLLFIIVKIIQFNQSNKMLNEHH